MGRRAITREFYESIVAAFRENPGNLSACSRRVGCDHKTAKIAWERGWVPRLPWAIPVRLRLLEEEEASRLAAARADQERAEALARDAAERAELLRKDAVERRSAMIQLSKGMRGTLAAMIHAMQGAGKGIMAVMQTFAADHVDDMRKWDAEKKLKFVVQVERAARDLAVAYGEVDRIARLDDDRPTEIVGVAVSMEDAANAIESAHRALELAREEGILDVPGLPGLPERAAGGGGNGVVH